MQFIKCGQCNKPFHKDEMIWAQDPYLEEIYPEDGPYDFMWWCDNCYGERSDEI